MITAIDSSVLLSIFKGEDRCYQWLELLAEVASDGELVICDVVAAEVGGFFKDVSAFTDKLDGLGLILTPTGLAACHHAGQIFQKYLKEGGQRKHLIPDFIIAAHALFEADALAADDRGYLRRYFRGLKILTPEPPD